MASGGRFLRFGNEGRVLIFKARANEPFSVFVLLRLIPSADWRLSASRRETPSILQDSPLLLATLGSVCARRVSLAYARLPRTYNL
jgi:hypothetical protein